MRRGSISLELLMCGGDVHTIYLLPVVARCLETIDACIKRMFVFMSVVVFRYADVVFVSCVHPVAVLNAAFCMTWSLLMLVEDARCNHMEEAYPRAGLGLMTGLYVAMSVSFCLPHLVVVSAFIICSGVCVCTVML